MLFFIFQLLVILLPVCQAGPPEKTGTPPKHTDPPLTPEEKESQSNIAKVVVGLIVFPMVIFITTFFVWAVVFNLRMKRNTSKEFFHSPDSVAKINKQQLLREEEHTMRNTPKA